METLESVLESTVGTHSGSRVSLSKASDDFSLGKPPSAVNFLETALGYGYALVNWVRIKNAPPDFDSWDLGYLSGIGSQFSRCIDKCTLFYGGARLRCI